YEPCVSSQPVIWYVHSGGHAWPSNATAYVVQFFQEHALPGPPPTEAVPTDLNASGAAAGSGNAGSSGDGGLATAAKLQFPQGIAVGIGGDFFIADAANDRIRRVGRDGIIARVPAGSFNSPFGIALDREGNLFVADTYNRRVQKVAPDGTISTVV